MFDPSQISSQTLKQSLGLSQAKLQPHLDQPISKESEQQAETLKQQDLDKTPSPDLGSDPLPSLASIGSAQKSMDFLDQIINPWEAPSLEEVKQGTRILKFREGKSVQQIQQRLAQLGYGLEPTGIMDHHTLTAVQLLHETEGFPFAENFDANSLNALEQAEVKLSQYQAEQALAEAS